ncbi:MAG TPA: carboxylate--amine ligase, partial [Candidatus Polarisedimenticolia bacterium]|nr:carboxylate--amine ligase [Candidatus Polarisedimenticolia bacterium]
VAARRLAGPRGRRVRRRAAACLGRLARWEFLPAWLIYLPVVPWIGWLSLRHGGFGTVTAANPGIPAGGFVGESKSAILSGLPPQWVVPFAVIPPGDPAGRSAALMDTMRRKGWSFPIVLKPDAGQRGAGVRLIRGEQAAQRYLQDNAAAVMAQAYHPGPREAGVFYHRIPGEARGRIFSLTDKRFPEAVGDGVSSLEDLIWSHPRHRLQAGVFLRRLGARAAQVPAAGERVPLAMAGNHCQGTMFLDGSRLITPELERAVDAIARAHPGFCFGRFDLRFASEEDLMLGRGFQIVELNGVTSESTDIYDPGRSLLWSYGVLWRQWGLLFRIGALQRRLGAPSVGAWSLLTAALLHARHPSAGRLAD